MLLAKLRAPDVEKPVAAVIVPVEFLVTVPLLVIAIEPVEVILLLIANVVPLKVADPTATVLLNVVALVAAFV